MRSRSGRLGELKASKVLGFVLNAVTKPPSQVGTTVTIVMTPKRPYGARPQRMIRLLNVYYPTRTVILFLCEAILVGSCFLLATAIVLGQDTYLTLAYEQGLLKIGGITALTIVLSYYFDLYEPQIVSVPLEIYFRILLVLGFDCFALSIVLYFYPEADIAQYVYPVGFALLSPVLIAWRKVYGRLVSHKFFRERVYVLGAGEQARSIVQTLQSRPDIGMEVVYWGDLHLEKPERKMVWIEDLARLTDAKPGVGAHRIIVAMEDSRDELPVQELLNLRFRGITVEKGGGSAGAAFGEDSTGWVASEQLFCMRKDFEFGLRSS